MTSENRIFSSLALLTVGIALVGCSARKPVDTVARAEMAVDHAVQNNAGAHAASDLQLAQDKLSSSRRAMDRDDNEEARRLADEALVHAQLAEAKAKSETARAEAEQTRRDIEALRQQTDTVVIERPAERVIVERPAAPDVVIERRSTPVIIDTR
jgi:hypothetical protein